MIKLSNYIIRFLEKKGVKEVFMLPGGGWMHLLDSLGRASKLNYTCMLHEQAASIAAEACAQYNRNLGVVMVTTGPGGTNAITGVGAAWVDSTPMLVLSGQVKTADLIGKSHLRQKGAQEINIIDLVKPITKYAVLVTKAEDIKYHLERAVYEATHGKKGPVWLDIPLDIQAAMIDENKLKGFTPPVVKKDKTLSSKISKVIELLNKAKQPLILAGNGINLAGAREDFLKLIKTLQVPVMTTWKTIDLLPNNSPLYVGRPGSIATRGANFNLQKADFLLCLGARLDLPQTAFNFKNFGRNAKKVIVDIDEAELKKFSEIFTVKADAKDFVSEFLKQIKKVNYKNTSWLRSCKEMLAKYPLVLPEFRKQKKYVNPYILLEELSKNTTKNDLIVPGSSGACSEITCQAFEAKEGQRFLNNQGFGSMGFGLPAALGAAIESKRRTICINGDGGLQLNIQELQTLKRLNLPVKLFVLNNQGYGSIRNMQNNHFAGNLVASDGVKNMTLPDIIKLAKAYGIKCERITNQNDLSGKIRKILNTKGPFICDVLIDPKQQTMPRVSSQKLPNGKMISKPIEDMFPFLPEKEIKENLKI
ncbi:MAG: thiamine pyrophosphate-binding protein [Elusimicrobiaceae bacterium]|nr:thiamine pyrophosphate-binding protein [Elusimicrobiaceae bacterium]